MLERETPAVTDRRAYASASSSLMMAKGVSWV